MGGEPFAHFPNWGIRGRRRGSDDMDGGKPRFATGEEVERFHDDERRSAEGAEKSVHVGEIRVLARADSRRG